MISVKVVSKLGPEKHTCVECGSEARNKSESLIYGKIYRCDECYKRSLVSYGVRVR